MVDSLLTQDQTDDNTDYYNLLVGEKAKFKNEKELAKGKYIADNYILTLETQMDQLRRDYEREKNENMAKAKLEDLLDQYQNRKPAPPQDTTDTVDKSPSINTKQIESLIENRMQERETSRKQSDNYNFVKNKLIEQYGQNYSNQLAQAITEFDMTEDQLNTMARSNPKALLKMMGVDPDPVIRDPFRAPPKTTISPFAPKPMEKRSWSYYQKMKDENPRKYFSRETNVQMHRDALDLGADFEDGDFGRFQKDFRISY